MRLVFKFVQHALVVVFSLGAIGSVVLLVAAFVPPNDFRYEDPRGLTECGAYKGLSFARATTPENRIWVYLAAYEGKLSGGGHLLIKKSVPYRVELGSEPLKFAFEIAPRIDPRTCVGMLEDSINLDDFKAIVTFVTPAWLPAPLFAAYPLWCFYRGPWRRRRRKAKGQCLRCGYDLTGNVTGVCSECGATIERPK